MQDQAGQLVLSPTDLTKHLACPHLTTLDLMAVRNELDPPDQMDETLELIFRLGLDHEKAYLAQLKANRDVVEIPDQGIELAERVARTEEAIRAGVEVIYQAAFLHDRHIGFADFLIRAARPSLLGPFSYDVADTKLARKMKVAALLQMADYGRHLERIQGAPPEVLTVVTGDGEEREFRYDDAAWYAIRATSALRDAIDSPKPTRAEPVEHCAQCRWSSRCEQEWRRDDHLSLVAFMRTDHRHVLEAAGITTVEALAATTVGDLPPSISLAVRQRLHDQAGLQVRERRTRSPHYRLLDPHEGMGLLRLPPPSPGDVYLDFEGDPYAEGGEGREYLAGLWDRTGTFTTYWAHSSAEEAVLTRELLDDLVGRLDADPDMHVYHYAPYERTALARLTIRHQVAEHQLDRLLRGRTLVDLYGVVRQGLQISKGSYSIKKLEAFYWGGVRGSGDQPDDVADAMASVVAYEKWLVDRDQERLDKIAAYNRDDVRSTLALHEWLEERRTELEAFHGPLPRPAVEAAAAAPVSPAEQVEIDLAASLHIAGHPLLAGLVGWHRRENRPAWWDFFRLEDLSDDDLVGDTAAIGGLGEPSDPRPLPAPARSTLWRYGFEPQDTTLSGNVCGVDEPYPAAGEIAELRADEGWLDVRVGNTKSPARVRAFGKKPEFNPAVMQESIQRTARMVLDGRPCSARALLEGVVPTSLAARPGETPSDVVERVGSALGNSVLAVQGPPGTGKTTAGARLIRALLDQNKKVGVTAQSHAVIGNLLKAVGRPALQKCEADDHCGAPGVSRAANNEDVIDGLASGDHRLVGGTAWLWSRPDMVDSVDVLVIDEAGQFSLANAVAVAPAAPGLVLLGDPQQLAQPSRTQHLDGADASALGHLLGGHATVPPNRGVFLDRTWRMHPDLAAVVSRLMYENRLGSMPECENQRLLTRDGLDGTGVRVVGVPHVGRESASIEEAAAVRLLVDRLLSERWRDGAGVDRPLGPDDILVVAPYNAHVGELRKALPGGVAVGTVDKFQGQEAPVVIYSMASSSVADAPRGVNFLYDLHRLNVAISRARCVAIIVCSPALLDADVRNPGQLRSVNGLLQVVDAATWMELTSSRRPAR